MIKMRKKPRIDNKLKKLKTIFISAKFVDVYKFFTRFLVKNSIIDCSIQYDSQSTQIKENFLEFFKSQKKIQKLFLSYVLPVFVKDGLKFLSKQKELKSLKIRHYEFGDKFLKLISYFTRLEVLELQITNFDTQIDWKIIENLKNLKEIGIESYSEDFSFYRDFKEIKIENLEKLIIPGDSSAEFFTEISQNLPNLKDLELVSSNQKLNSLAKVFPNLEKLTVIYDKSSLLSEPNTGISNENLRELKFSFRPEYENENCYEHFLNVFDIFPNLEVFDFCEPSFAITFNKILFLKFNSLKKLRILRFSFVVIENCLEFVEEFKKLAQKLKEIKIIFFGSKEENLSEIDNENIEKFKEIVKSYYKVEPDDQTDFLVMSKI
jgi:hypothetical protein